MTTPTLTPLARLQAACNAALIERGDEIRAILLALVAREHCLMVGPPGTAKSLTGRSIVAGIQAARYCERLLSPTTPPEAIFGPISLKALREDRYEHNGAGTVTDCEVAFLDEVFRASPAILDSLLHLLGPERQALIGTQQVRVPLITAIGASNTWGEAAEQAAVMDRWLIRCTVRPVSPQGREALLFGALAPVTPVCTLADVQAATAQARQTPISAAARQALVQMLDELAAAGIRPSDRRTRAALKVACAAAVIDGAAEVQPGHLEDLRMVLWDDPREQPEKAAEIIVRIANPTGARLNALLAEADSIVREAGTDAAARTGALKKLQEVETEVSKLRASGNGRAAAAAKYVSRERIRIQAALLGLDPAKAEALLGAVQ